MTIKTFVTLVVGAPGSTQNVAPGEYDADKLKALGVDVPALIKRGQAEEVVDDATPLPDAPANGKAAQTGKAGA